MAAAVETAVAVEAPPVAAFWVETADDSGNTYFYHSQTLETVWERPADGVPVIPEDELEDPWAGEDDDGDDTQVQATKSPSPARSDTVSPVPPSESASPVIRQPLARATDPPPALSSQVSGSVPAMTPIAVPPPTPPPDLPPPPSDEEDAGAHSGSDVDADDAGSGSGDVHHRLEVALARVAELEAENAALKTQVGQLTADLKAMENRRAMQQRSQSLNGLPSGAGAGAGAGSGTSTGGSPTHLARMTPFARSMRNLTSSSSRGLLTPPQDAAGSPISSRSNKEKMSFLKSVPLFHSLSEDQFEDLCRSLQRVTFDAGEVIIRQGDNGDTFYVIETGKVAVRKLTKELSTQRSLSGNRSFATSIGSSDFDDDEKDGDSDDIDFAESELDRLYGVVVAELARGFFFGEAALLTDARRTATCMTLTPVSAWMLHRSAFSRVLSSVNHLLASYGRKMRNNESPEALGFARHINGFSMLLDLAAESNDPDAPVQDVELSSVSVGTLPQAAALIRLMSLLPPELGLSSVFETFIQDGAALMNTESCRLVLLDDANSQFMLRHSNGYTRLPVASCHVLTAALKAESVVVSQTIAEDERFANADGLTDIGKSQQAIDEVYGTTSKSLMCVPVYSTDRLPLGVIQFVNKISASEAERVVDKCAGAAAAAAAGAGAIGSAAAVGAAPAVGVPTPKPASVSEATGDGAWDYFGSRDRHVAEGIGELFSTAVEERQSEFGILMGERGTTKPMPLYQVTQNFKIAVYGARQLPIIGKKRNSPVSVRISLHHGVEMLCAPISTDPAPFSIDDAMARTGSAMWQDKLTLGITFNNLPSSARIIFNVYCKEGPLGWAGCQLFTYQRALLTGQLDLRMWPGECTPEMAGSATALNNRHGDPATTSQLIVSLHQFARPVVRVDVKEHQQITGTRPLIKTTGRAVSLLSRQYTEAEATAARPAVLALCKRDILHTLTDEERDVVWQSRMFITDLPEALPWFLESVNWGDGPAASQALSLLTKWKQLSPVAALQLLDVKFPDPRVRAYAVTCLEALSDDQLQRYMLQLTQVLKFEPFEDSALARFLLRRALRNTRKLGHVFYWYLQAEMHVVDVQDRYGALLEQYLRNCGEHRSELGHQSFVMAKLQEIALAVKAKHSKEERLATLRSALPQIGLPTRFQLPLAPSMIASGFNVSQCRVMSSKKLPLWLSFKDADDPTQSITCLFKAGDDLRQDQLTLQVLKIMDSLWKQEGLDFRMSPYLCVSTGDELGMLEVVLNSCTLAEVVIQSVKSSKGLAHKIRVAKQRLKVDVLHEWLLAQPGNAENMNKVYDNFARSVAGYCVATYVMGIGDRHNDNIMITRDGCLFHIDFGHFLGNFKSKAGIKRERAPFIFTTHFADVLGGPGHPRFVQFEEYCVQAFNILRRSGNLLITLFFLMLSCGIPELQTPADLKWLQDTLMMDKTDEEAGEVFKKLILQSLHTKMSTANDIFHLIRHA